MKLTVPAGYGRFGDERGRLTLVRPASAIPGPGPGSSGRTWRKRRASSPPCWPRRTRTCCW